MSTQRASPAGTGGRRVLITGLSTYWGGRLAQALERDPGVDVIVGVSPEDPTCELTRTEYVRVANQHALLARIVQAAAIDTVIDTRLIVDSVNASPRAAHENNVIGTMNILAACGGPGSPVRKVVFKSSAHFYGCERDDPAYFTEAMRRPHPPRTLIEKDIVEAECAVEAFAARHRDVTVTVLRFVNGLGPDITTSHSALLSLPVVPSILGFDPRYQFIHEDDIAGVLEHAAVHDLPGTYNAAGDGVLVLSEIASLLGRPPAPLLPPWGTGIAAAALRRVGVRIPPEMLQQLRYGRALDNRRLKTAGYSFRATSRETVQAFAQYLRTRGLRTAEGEGYQYEREVEEFLRWSPAVRGDDRLGLARLGRDQLAELARALESARGARPARPARPAPRGTPPDGTLRTGSPSSSGGAADPEPAADP
ncbi:MAG TPA: NAD-dependent epimerase/dehydratase family protein [Solirubrobacteraceae bacterium]|nr:NAD-dependent epimerase/dehydratase family protein [Solirubrobacteraceae bacterium]